jgi:hypothetical protein
MGYPKDLDEYTDAELAKEIVRRWLCKEQSICHYCNQPLGTHTCKYAAIADTAKFIKRHENDDVG